MYIGPWQEYNLSKGNQLPQGELKESIEDALFGM